VYTPYFDRFNDADLQDGGPYQILDINGNLNTIVVHAATVFESALQVYEYRDFIFKLRKIHDALPRSKEDGKIAIIGAGPSGLLAAKRLTDMGYKVKIFEADGRYGGKTHTEVLSMSDGKKVHAEMGTCYLSPAYKPLVEYLGISDQLRNLDGKYFDPNFQGVLTEGQPGTYKAKVMPFNDYVLARAAVETGHGTAISVAEMAMAIAKYAFWHHFEYGSQRPFPKKLPKKLMKKSYLEFLKEHDMAALTGLLQYGYEVQGYGNLNTISAFYCLMWMKSDNLERALVDNIRAALHMEQEQLISIIDNGWGSVWDTIVKDLKSNSGTELVLNAAVSKIDRPN